MEKTTGILATLIVAAGLSVMVTQGALAQPKEGCEDATPGETAMQDEASEDGSGAPGTGVGGPEVGAEEHAAMEGSVEGSGAPMPGRGECDEIDTLPQAKTEG